MVRTPTRTFVAIAMAVTALAVVGVPAGAKQAVGPNQPCAGLVNGTRMLAVVHTICSGPASAGRTGPVVGGQTLAVARAGAGLATPDRSPRSTPGSLLRAGRRPHPSNSRSPPTGRRSRSLPRCRCPVTGQGWSSSARALTWRRAPSAGPLTTSTCSS